MAADTALSRGPAALAERMDPLAVPRLEARVKAGIPYLEARLPGPFRALFTTRLGGESGGPYATMNLRPGSADDRPAVERNRSKVAGLMIDESAGDATGPGPSAPRLVSPMQAHGTRVLGAAEYVGRLEPRETEDDVLRQCDGLTLHPVLDRGLAPLLLYADCVPLVMVGEVDMAVIHGGWRGIIGGIVHEGARAMTGPPGLAVIGPSIGPCCFEVSKDVAEAFCARFGREVVSDDTVAPRIDLWASVTRALAEVGVGAHQVVNPRLCTACNTDLFFSHRAEGPMTGRQGCLAWTVAA